MKRLVCHRYGPPKDLVLEDAPWPEPGPGRSPCAWAPRGWALSMGF